MTLTFLKDDEVLSGKAVVYSDTLMSLIIHAKDNGGNIRCIVSGEAVGDNYNDDQLPIPNDNTLNDLKEIFIELYEKHQFSEPKDSFSGKDLILTNKNFSG